MISSGAGWSGTSARTPFANTRTSWRSALAPKSSARHCASALRPVRGRAVLVHTGWDRYWETETYFDGHPYLTEAAACFLRDEGAALVGIDSYNIDDTGGKTRPVHSILLEAEIPIVEHMTGLGRLPKRMFRFTAVPVKVERFGTFPVRAFAKLEDS